MKQAAKQFISYGFFSALALGFEIGLLYFFTSIIGVNYLISATVAFILMVSGMYWVSRRWIFTAETGRSRLMDYVIFTVIGLVGLVINDSIIWLLVSRLGIHYTLAKLVAAGFVFLWNFTARYALFTSAPVLAKQVAEEEA